MSRTAGEPLLLDRVILVVVERGELAMESVEEDDDTTTWQ